MRTVGVICEYNPFHKGHLRQFRLAREAVGEDCALVCLMSGNYVQRGAPAIFPKQLRAQAALRCGADLVLELPLTVALSSAEGFAAGGVSILSALGCDCLCFGTESGDLDALLRTARANLDPAFDELLKRELASGIPYAAARRRALECLVAGRSQSLSPGGEVPPQGTDEGTSLGSVLSRPNDILAVEYCKALLRQNSPMRPMAIHRPDTYHSVALDPTAPSASALRQMLRRDEHCSSGIRNECDLSKSNSNHCAAQASPDWRDAVPPELVELYAAAPVHTPEAGERAVLAIVRTLPEAAFAALPYGSEGLWSKFMKACRACASVEEIIETTKSKRYPRTRIQRMLLCAFLGLRAADLEALPPYARVLGFNDRGRVLLREMKRRFPLVNAGERPAHEGYYALERRASDLYSLFSEEGPRPSGEEARLRVLSCLDHGV